MKAIQLGIYLALGCLLSGAQVALNSWPHRNSSSLPAVRLLGPAAELGRSLQWIRFQRALLRGDHPRALILGESAIALDPSSTESWQLLVAHLGYYRASPERESDLERRRLWLQAAVELTLRGAQHARQPELLHLQRGLMLISKMDLDPMIDREGPAGLFERALLALREAAELGDPSAIDLLQVLEAKD